MRNLPAIRLLASSPAARRICSTINGMATRPAAAGLPAIATGVLAWPHDVVIVLVLTAAALLVPAVTAIAAELPRLYWLLAYTRLVRKGTKLATTPQEILELIAGLAAAHRLVPKPSCRPAGGAQPKRHRGK